MSIYDDNPIIFPPHILSKQNPVTLIKQVLENKQAILEHIADKNAHGGSVPGGVTSEELNAHNSDENAHPYILSLIEALGGGESVQELLQLIESHTHDGNDSSQIPYANILNAPTTLPADGGNADTVDGKHAADFADVIHGHAYSDITGTPSALPANGGDADTVDGKHAADFADAVHGHAYSDITGTPSALPANGGDADTVDGKHASEFRLASESNFRIFNNASQIGITLSPATTLEEIVNALPNNSIFIITPPSNATTNISPSNSRYGLLYIIRQSNTRCFAFFYPVGMGANIVLFFASIYYADGIYEVRGWYPIYTKNRILYGTSSPTSGIGDNEDIYIKYS